MKKVGKNIPAEIKIAENHRCTHKKQKEDGRIDPQWHTNICVYIGKNEQPAEKGIHSRVYYW